jgi:hypothetical protein
MDMTIDNNVILPLDSLDVISERPEVLVALLKRVKKSYGCRCVSVTFDELASECGYANRSGVWKYMNKLQSAGLVKKLGRGMIKVELKRIS